MIDRVETTVYAHLPRGCPIRVEQHLNGPFSHMTVLIGVYGEVRLLLPDPDAVVAFADALVASLGDGHVRMAIKDIPLGVVAVSTPA